MIKVITKEKKGRKQKPSYRLEYYYMIGDANGRTTESVKVSIENPFVERYCKLLNGLKPVQGHWGVSLQPSVIRSSFQEGQITEDDYNFLMYVMFEEENDYFKSGSDEEEYVIEFLDGVRSENEYTFLCFEGVALFYYDEYGKKFETEFED